jgi:hypothetical protein
MQFMLKKIDNTIEVNEAHDKLYFLESFKKTA